MNIITANEIKKHGVTVIEKRIQHGALHVLKHNRPLFVVLSIKEYDNIIHQQTSKKTSGLFAMLKKGVTGTRTREEIDLTIKADRDNWDK